MAYKAEVLFCQGWHVTLHWTEFDARYVARQRYDISQGTVNPGRGLQVVKLPYLVDPTPPEITFDEYCDQLWPSTAPKT